jgi:hypothetical protein
MTNLREHLVMSNIYSDQTWIWNDEQLQSLLLLQKFKEFSKI